MKRIGVYTITMKYVQTKIDETEYKKLKIFCLVTEVSLSLVLSRLIHAFVSSAKFEETPHYHYKKELLNATQDEMVDSFLSNQWHSIKHTALEQSNNSKTKEK